MLEDTVTPAKASKLSQRQSLCLVCGAEVWSRTTPRKYCAPCAIIQKRLAAARSEKRSEPLQGPGIFGTCERCGIAIEKISAKRRWCDACKTVAANVQARARRGQVPIGSVQQCRNCPAQFTKTHKRQFYCPPCHALSDQEKFPEARKRLNERNKRFRKEKYHKDPMFALNVRMTARVAQSLRKGKAGRSWETLVGYTLEELKRHLERQFTKGMSWENRSAFDIDHIRPLSSFTFTSADDPAFRDAWALTNLRPLGSSANRKKHAKRIYLI